jgi:heat shock protein HslJ
LVAASAITVVVVGLVACGPDAAPPSVVGLAGTSWTVTTLNGGGVIPNALPTITFSTDKRVAGSTGCNQYSALYATDGNHITIGALTATEMACEGAHSAEEQIFLKGIDGAATWHLTESGDLEIDGVVTIVARPAIAATQPPPTVGASVGAGLAGTSWNLFEMGGTADFAHLVPTIDFGADGTVSGFAGCNRFGGTFTVEGRDLHLGPLATTKIFCQRPASAVEGDYLKALVNVATWEISGSGRLELGGGVSMTFTPR